MATWPETNPAPVYPLIVTPVFKTLVSPFDNGAQQRRAKQVFPTYDVTVRYRALSAADMQTLWSFYLARQGGFEAFWIYDLALSAGVSFTHAGQYVGTGDGGSVFDLPGRATSSHTIYVNGSEETGVTILSGGGQASADRVQFTVGPTTGAQITADFTGYLRIRARFKNDMFNRELFMNNLFQTGAIALEGLTSTL